MMNGDASDRLAGMKLTPLVPLLSILTSWGCLREVKDDPQTPDPEPIPVRGTIADVKTRDGETGSGYRVSRSCKSSSCIGLQAMRGTNQYVSDSPEMFERLRSAVHQSCKPSTSLFSSGIAGDCVGGAPALVLWMFDWREVDAVISCAGQQLVKSDSRDRVAICVTPRGFSVEDVERKP